MPSDATPQKKIEGSGADELSWQVDAPLLTNCTVWFGLLVSLGTGAAYLVSVLLGLALYEERWESIIPSALLSAGILAGLLVACAPLMVAVFGWRVPTEYRLTKRYIAQAHKSRRARRLNWLVLIVAPFFGTRGAGLAGSAALAEARQTAVVSWRDVSAARFQPSAAAHYRQGRNLEEVAGGRDEVVLSWVDFRRIAIRAPW